MQGTWSALSLLSLCTSREGMSFAISLRLYMSLRQSDLYQEDINRRSRGLNVVPQLHCRSLSLFKSTIVLAFCIIEHD